MTASASRGRRDVPVWDMAPSLARLPPRQGERPGLDPQWPCLQRQGAASAEAIDALAGAVLRLPGVEACAAPHHAPGRGYALNDALARGQPEAFIGGPCWLVLRPDGSLHLSLRPNWAQKVVDKGWTVVHPFARYMAGAVPPQSLVVYAPRDRQDLGVVLRIIEAAHGYATGRIGNVILPDTRW